MVATKISTTAAAENGVDGEVESAAAAAAIRCGGGGAWCHAAAAGGDFRRGTTATTAAAAESAATDGAVGCVDRSDRAPAHVVWPSCGGCCCTVEFAIPVVIGMNCFVKN